MASTEDLRGPPAALPQSAPVFYASRERRYQEQTAGKPPAIGTLYVQKWLLGESPPPTLSVTIQEGAR